MAAITRFLLRQALAVALAAAGAACTTLPPAPLLQADACTRWFERLDAAVDAHGVRDAQDERIDGLPFLRVDRLAVAARATQSFADWLARAASLDRDARAAETANLPAAAFPLDGAADAAAAGARSQACRDALSQRLQSDAGLQRVALERARVPDRYSTARRAAGAYPLLRLPFFAGVQAWEREHTAAVARWEAQPPPRVMRFEPPPDDAHAPLFEIEWRQDPVPPFDRFGAPVWPSLQAATPRVDTARPVVFVRRTHALHGGHWLRQQVYTLWFSERPADPRWGGLDLLAGNLDGVIVRLTLGVDGQVLMLDTIHACGCWHQFYPAAGVTPRADAPTQQEWAFVPAALPALGPGQRLVVRLASATHHVTGIGAAALAGAAERYTLRDENALRSLPVEGVDGGARRSLYGPDGLVAGSQRAERFLFWPMGIASAGQMRQWGHHATAFVGRRHFDDPNLLWERFVLPPGPRP
jgi:hypothetical protein